VALAGAGVVIGPKLAGIAVAGHRLVAAGGGVNTVQPLSYTYFRGQGIRLAGRSDNVVQWAQATGPAVSQASYWSAHYGTRAVVYGGSTYTGTMFVSGITVGLFTPTDPFVSQGWPLLPYEAGVVAGTGISHYLRREPGP
jgi:hypothetical protein